MQFIWNEINRIAFSDNILMTLMVIPVLFVIERVFAAHRVTAQQYRFGFVFFLVNAVLLGLISPALSYLSARGVQALGFGLIDLRAFGLAGISGSLVALLIATFVTDFFYYWFHRALHHNKILWQAHLLHHSDENMNMLTAQRGHVFETIISPLFITLPMAILFRLPALEIAILSLIPQAYHFFSHANIRLGYGRLWWVIISPDYHRIHHSVEAAHRDKNFTNWFPVWDIIFGTVYRPSRQERPETGVKGVRVNTLLDAYALPVREWRKLWARHRIEREKSQTPETEKVKASSTIS